MWCFEITSWSERDVETTGKFGDCLDIWAGKEAESVKNYLGF